ncbi:MAG TPA: PilZ domain-containing protein [Vicinamibacteria bacterium]
MVPSVATTPRARRLDLRLPVEVSGRDRSGRAFTETGLTRNISGGGICFESSLHPPIGSRLVLRIQVPPALRARFGQRSVYEVQAVVCRVENFQGEASSRVGARFVGETS